MYKFKQQPSKCTTSRLHSVLEKISKMQFKPLQGQLLHLFKHCCIKIAEKSDWHHSHSWSVSVRALAIKLLSSRLVWITLVIGIAQLCKHCRNWPAIPPLCPWYKICFTKPVKNSSHMRVQMQHQACNKVSTGTVDWMQ